MIDEKGNEHGIITRDTLFIGDVGRPELAQHVIVELTKEKLANHLFDSSRNKIMPLWDDLIVYPNQGTGSAGGIAEAFDRDISSTTELQINTYLTEEMKSVLDVFIKSIVK